MLSPALIAHLKPVCSRFWESGALTWLPHRQYPYLGGDKDAELEAGVLVALLLRKARDLILICSLKVPVSHGAFLAECYRPQNCFCGQLLSGPRLR